MHVRCSEVLVKDIQLCKVTGGQSESSSIRHRDFGCSECLADEGRTPPGSPTASFLCSHVGWCLDCTYLRVLVDLSKSATGVCRSMCEVGKRTSAGECRCQTPIRQPLPVSVRMDCVRCTECIPCDPSGGVYGYA